jgi:hypothetical protein
MKHEFPAAVPEIPVAHIDQAAAYYVSKLGFALDWGNEAGGIAGISRGQCRIFLTNPAFRQMHGNAGPVLIWLNLASRDAVNELHAQWSASHARILSAPESKAWKLHEFTAADPDGNLLRVFYDFAWEERGTS